MSIKKLWSDTYPPCNKVSGYIYLVYLVWPDKEQIWPVCTLIWTIRKDWLIYSTQLQSKITFQWPAIIKLIRKLHSTLYLLQNLCLKLHTRIFTKGIDSTSYFSWLSWQSLYFQYIYNFNSGLFSDSLLLLLP